MGEMNIIINVTEQTRDDALAVKNLLKNFVKNKENWNIQVMNYAEDMRE